MQDIQAHRRLPRPALIAWVIAAAAGILSFVALDFPGYITGTTAFAFKVPSTASTTPTRCLCPTSC